MRTPFRRLGCLLVALLPFGTVMASDADVVDTCVDLSDASQLRHNGAQFLYVRDGADHYRVAFRDGRCDPMTMTSRLAVSTEGAANRLCPTGTRVKAKGRSCQVSGIERISGEDFARRLRRR